MTLSKLKEQHFYYRGRKITSASTTLLNVIVYKMKKKKLFSISVNKFTKARDPDVIAITTQRQDVCGMNVIYLSGF